MFVVLRVVIYVVECVVLWWCGGVVVFMWSVWYMLHTPACPLR